jgi:endoglucanase
MWAQTSQSVGSHGLLRGIAPDEEAAAVGLALVQAVYAGDRETFDLVWTAAKGDSLDLESGLLRSAQSGGGSGTPGSAASASDLSANQYAALALALGSKAWTVPVYAEEARTLLDAIWAAHSQQTYAGAVLSVGTDEGGTRAVPVAGIVPFAYPIFASIDPQHDWLALRDGSYALLKRVMARPSSAESGLLPDTIHISATNGRPLAIEPDELSGSGAAQLAWQLAVDWIWTNDPRPAELLTELQRPVGDLVAYQGLPATYQLDGSRGDVGAPMRTYAQWVGPTLLGPEPQVAHLLLGERILRPLLEGEEAEVSFIDRSWGWLSAALLDGGLTNIYRGYSVVDWRGQF